MLGVRTLIQRLYYVPRDKRAFLLRLEVVNNHFAPSGVTTYKLLTPQRPAAIFSHSLSPRRAQFGLPKRPKHDENEPVPEGVSSREIYVVGTT